MSEPRFHVTIPKTKAELPALIVIMVLVMVGFAFHYGIFGWMGSFIYLAIALSLVFWLYIKRKGDYFVLVDKDGVSWRDHFFSSYKFIPWKFIQRIDYLVFEINFMLKETAQVVSFGTSGLSDEDAEKMKQTISDIIEEREKNNEL